MSASKPSAPDVLDDESDVTPEEEEIVLRAEEAERHRAGSVVQWDVLFPSAPVALDEGEEEELSRRLDEIPELDRRRALRPLDDFIAEMRAEIRQRRAG